MMYGYFRKYGIAQYVFAIQHKGFLTNAVINNFSKLAAFADSINI